ncbi:MAG: biopolymer transporter ExbD [Chthoniobacterales bacterium]
MKLHRSPQPRQSLLYLAPFISMGMILMGLLPLCTSFLLQPGIAVNVPLSPFLLLPQQDPEIVSITATPVPTVFFANEEVAPGDLATRLDQHKARSRTVIIKADRKAPLELVVNVMNQVIQRGYSVVLATSPGHGN